eukprot:gb/GEZN01000777.1/.p1 GENE.gb/GEZN01000777.1/~~gb/GEZN01000777.1/.p1  ORF type:complete len:874 (-),score=118.75 gb/GEZN01000777.1/:993-3614(-)
MDELVRALKAAGLEGDQMATQKLRQLEQRDYGQYVRLMTTVLSSENVESKVRHLAGLNVKNTIKARSEAQQRKVTERWILLPDTIRNEVKQKAVLTMRSRDAGARNSACLVVAGIATIEVPCNKWDPKELVAVLCKQIDQKESPLLREATFKALGWIVEEVADSLRQESNAILTAISKGLANSEQSVEILKAAADALAYYLEFADKNMGSEKERAFIMKMIFSIVNRSNKDVQSKGMKCFIALALAYYHYLADYMVPIFELTKKIIITYLKMTNENKVAQQDPVTVDAIEFWCTLADEELEMQTEMQEARERNLPIQQKYHAIVQRALPELMPLCLECLTRQPTDLDENDQAPIPAKRAALFIKLAAKCTKSAILPHVMPFVNKFVKNPDWRYKEAATLAFGCILDGPEEEKLQAFAGHALRLVLPQFQDKHPVVRDTAAWVVSQICESAPQAATDPQIFNDLLKALAVAFKMEPKIAVHACQSIWNLADNGKDRSECPLWRQPLFGQILLAMLAIAERPDSSTEHLKETGYDTIYNVIQCAPEHLNPIIEQLFPKLLQRLGSTVSAQMQSSSSEEKERNYEVQGLLCATLTACVRKVSIDYLEKYMEPLMKLLNSVLNSRNPGLSAMEDAMLTIGAVAAALGPRFRYAPAFQNALIKGLKAIDEPGLMTKTITTIGDIVQAVEGKFDPMADDIMTTLLGLLEHQNVETNIKPSIISAIGDIALNIGPRFERFLPRVLKIFHDATLVTLDPNDLNDVDYLNQLHICLLEAYSSLFQGLAEKVGHMMPAMPGLFEFLLKIAKNFQARRADENVLNAALGLIGDLAEKMGKHPLVAKKLQTDKAILFLIQSGIQSKTEKVKTNAGFARDSVRPTS